MSDEQKAPVRRNAQAPPKGGKKRFRTLKALAQLIVKLAVVAAVCWAALTYVFGVFRISGNGMYPALRDGDLCVTYRLEDYRADEVVAYRADGAVRFGRIVAVAGQTADGDEQGLLVNGVHRSEEIFYPTQMLDTALSLPVRLEEGQVLILNDHRTELSDSRTFGLIDEADLEGKVIFFFRRRGF